ncbi:MAG: YdcF family protein [Clostridia bacterium]|nr:YdcF family protein [Clostridia bacterium]MBP3652890.1 YdcF family protein [Clostridia bacterium]
MKLVWFLRVCVIALVCVFFAVEGIILAAGFTPAPQGLDAIIVLGAKVNGREPSGALRNRIQVAGEYLEANPDTIAVLSGGQGSDEDISEAQCMYENLVAMGIDPARLILEDRSTDTSENLLYSRELIPEDSRVGLVTNNFHIFRSLALARGLGWDVKGVPVATSWFSIPHYYMREFVGVVYDGVRGNLAF